MTNPLNYLFQRGKRAREPEWCDDLRTFREETKIIIRELMTEQETELKKLFTPSLAEIQKSNRAIEASVAQVPNNAK
ncbi:putative periplasmic zinc-binding protein TroA [Operophtera brumata]|uniref:Putative periplasmic zinc-binding protein TroA n=1 Tax=Operophtera brumata TaxID=104452 RepID=A0A0L7KX58_OPEBR|nr:putative periplasmic zinc-binding protein TroA [Operophtera brumata]